MTPADSPTEERTISAVNRPQEVPPVEFVQLDDWKWELTNEIATRFCAIAKGEVQKQVGFWHFNDSLPYPDMDCIKIVDGGSLTFSLQIMNTSVFFSVWLQFGEVRIGVRLPASLVNKDGNEERISKSYDGQPCSRIQTTQDGCFFDWIYRSDFADFKLMLESLADPLLRQVIADRIACILTHLYMAIVNTLIASRGLKVVFNRLCTPDQCVRVTFTATGDKDAILQHIASHGALITEYPQDEHQKMMFLVDTVEDRVMKFARGPYRDMDGGEFVITMSEKINKQQKTAAVTA